MDIGNSTSSLQAALPNKLKGILDDSPLTVFSDIVDHGYFSWVPSGNYKKLYAVTISEIEKGIQYNSKPGNVQSIDSLRRKCPLKFNKTTGKDKRKNEFPYDPSYLIPLHVAAVDRGVDLSTIHFKFGGSTINMLASQSLQGTEYRAQLVPGTTIVLIQKLSDYSINLSEDGFQFENFCLNGQLKPGNINEYRKDIHLQTITVNNKWNILVSAECDGIDKYGDPVEIKCTANTIRNAKVAFQMISASSLTLYGANRDKTTLKGVHSISLGKILKDNFASDPKLLQRYETNLLNGLQTLSEAVDKGQFDQGRLLTIQFRNHRLELNPISLLPPETVVKQFLERRHIDGA